jgi:hypothetical protein
VCTTVCNSTNGSPTCSAGSCGITCNGGYGNCDGTLTNGCEANLNTDTTHCGNCTTACSTNHASPSCNSGVCVLTCASGYTNCDGNTGNGCEIQTSADVTHCGNCSTVCSTNNGTPSCGSGTCGISCNTGWGNCDGNIANGCEDYIYTDVNNCGVCGVPCGSPSQVASKTCSGGACQVVSCNAGYYNQNGTWGDGCECAADAVPDTCTGLTNNSIVIDGTYATSGNILGSTDVDYYMFTFSQYSCSFNPKVVLTNNGNPIFMEVFSACSSGAGSGSTACSEGGNSATGNYTSWEFTYSGGSGNCYDTGPIDPFPYYYGAFLNPFPTTVYVKVYGTGNNTSCMAYTLTVTN